MIALRKRMRTERPRHSTLSLPQRQPAGMSSFVGRAAKSAANVRHLLASMLGAGSALIFAKFVLPPGEAEAAGDFQQPAGEEHQQGGSPTSSSSSKDELQLVQVVFRWGWRGRLHDDCTLPGGGGHCARSVCALKPARQALIARAGY